VRFQSEHADSIVLDGLVAASAPIGLDHGGPLLEKPFQFFERKSVHNVTIAEQKAGQARRSESQ
jgi:hypothetical protein